VVGKSTGSTSADGRAYRHYSSLRLVLSGRVRLLTAIRAPARGLARRRTEGRNAFAVFLILHAGTCGIPSIWRSPTTRCPRGNMSMNYRPTCPACPRGSAW
jgi:hypothetical protein